MKTTILTLLLAIFYQAGNSQDAPFYKSIHDSIPHFKSLTNASNCGYASVISDHIEEVCVFKYNCQDSIEWQSCFISPNTVPIKLVETDDSGFVVLANQVNSGIISMHLTKFDKSGTIVWSKLYEPNSSNFMYTISKCANNSFLVGGGGCTGNNTLLRINATNGSIIWQYQYTSNTGSFIRDIIPTGDGNYVVAATTSYFYDTFLFKIDVNGNIIWNRLYDLSIIEFIYDIKELPDQSLVLLGHSKALDDSLNNMTLLKTDLFGTNPVCQVFNRSQNESFGHAISIFGDGSLLLSGDIYLGNGLNLEGLIIKLNANLDQIEYSVRNGGFVFNHAMDDTNQDAISIADSFALIGGTLDGATLIKWPYHGYWYCVPDTIHVQMTQVPCNVSTPSLVRSNINYPVVTLNQSVLYLNKKEEMFCGWVSTEEHLKTEEAITIYPNPSGDIINFKNVKYPIESVMILQTDGRVVSWYNGLPDSKISISHLQNGIYFLRVKPFNEQETILPFIKN